MLISLINLISVLSLQPASSANTDEKPIKYPGPIQETTNRYDSVDFEVTVPEECRNKKFCLIKPKDYPQAHFNNMFKKYNKPHQHYQQPSLLLEDIDNRQGDPSETSGCETEITYQPLYQVRSNIGQVRTVVQAPDHDYVQKIRLEECKDTTSRCFPTFADSLGIESHCRQTVAKWEVLVSKGNLTELIETELPMCCSCVYKQK